MSGLDGPRWELEVAQDRFLDGTLRARVSSIQLEATTDGADQLTIEASMWDDRARRYVFGPGEPLALGSEVVVWAGYGSDLHALQGFRIVSHEPRLVAGEAPTLRAIGYSAEHRLVAAERDRVFAGPIADSEIASRIAQAHGLGLAQLDTTASREAGRVKAKGDSDWLFLRQLATANGFGSPFTSWNARTRRADLHFGVTDLRRQAELVTWRLRVDDAAASTLLSFSPETSIGDCPTAVEVTGYDPARGEAITVTVTIDQGAQSPVAYTGRPTGPVDPRLRSGTQVQLAIFAGGSSTPDGEQREIVSLGEGAPRTEEELVAWAKRWLATRNRAFMRARAETIGYHAAWPGKVHRFAGLPPEYEGLWEADAVSHKWDAGGWRCSWDLSRVLEDAGAPRLGA